MNDCVSLCRHHPKKNQIVQKYCYFFHFKQNKTKSIENLLKKKVTSLKYFMRIDCDLETFNCLIQISYKKNP